MDRPPRGVNTHYRTNEYYSRTVRAHVQDACRPTPSGIVDPMDTSRRDILAATLALGSAPSLAAASERMLRLPREFLWGTAISGHQSEGNNTNSDSWV